MRPRQLAHLQLAHSSDVSIPYAPRLLHVPRVPQARNWNTLFPGGKGDNPTRIDYTEEGDEAFNPHLTASASDRDLVSGASASATEDEGPAGMRAGVSRMDVEEDEYDEVG